MQRFRPYAPWRKLQDGTGWLIVVAGPLVGGIWGAVRGALTAPRRPSLWLLSELPIRDHSRGIPGRPGSVAAPARGRGARPRRAVWPRYLASAMLAAGHVPEPVRLTVRPRAIPRVGTARRGSTAANADSIPARSSSSSTPGDELKCSTLRHRRPLELAEKIRRLQGPILVLGASGFVGANLLRTLLSVRSDVFGTTTRKPAWRLEDLPDDKVRDGGPADRLEPGRPAGQGPAPHRLQLRRLRRLLVRDRQPADLPDQLPASSPGCCRRLERDPSPATSMPAAPRSTATTRPVRRKRTRLPPTATTPFPRSPRPT